MINCLICKARLAGGHLFAELAHQIPDLRVAFKPGEQGLAQVFFEPGTGLGRTGGGPDALRPAPVAGPTGAVEGGLIAAIGIGTVQE